MKEAYSRKTIAGTGKDITHSHHSSSNLMATPSGLAGLHGRSTGLTGRGTGQTSSTSKIVAPGTQGSKGLEQDLNTIFPGKSSEPNYGALGRDLGIGVPATLVVGGLGYKLWTKLKGRAAAKAVNKIVGEDGTMRTGISVSPEYNMTTVRVAGQDHVFTNGKAATQYAEKMKNLGNAVETSDQTVPSEITLRFDPGWQSPVASTQEYAGELTFKQTPNGGWEPEDPARFRQVQSALDKLMKSTPNPSKGLRAASRLATTLGKENVASSAKIEGILTDADVEKGTVTAIMRGLAAKSKYLSEETEDWSTSAANNDATLAKDIARASTYTEEEVGTVIESTLGDT